MIVLRFFVDFCSVLFFIELIAEYTAGCMCLGVIFKSFFVKYPFMLTPVSFLCCSQYTR